MPPPAVTPSSAYLLLLPDGARSLSSAASFSSAGMEHETHGSSSPAARSPGEPEAKRRKLRKGTHSCWDCKRRKVKCSFAVPTDSVCVPCRRRGAKCVSQDLPDVVEVEADARSDGVVGREMDERIMRVETLIEKLVDKTAKKSRGLDADGELDEDDDVVVQEFPTPADTIPTPRTMSTGQGRTTSTAPSIRDDSDEHPCRPILPTSYWDRACIDDKTLPRAGKHSDISKALYAAFPCDADNQIICNSVQNANAFFHEMSTKSPFHTGPSKIIHSGDETPPPPRPTPDLHPVLLARKMLIVGLYLQHLHLEAGMLSEPPRAIMHRLASTATGLVTTNEEFFGSIECLEAIMLDGLFQANCGNLRRSWLAFRRALAAAQLMGINRKRVPPLKKLDPNTRIDPHFTWFRIVYMDRFLCLLMGLPQAFHGELMEIPLSCATPTSRFQRTHGVVAGRILERNHRDVVEDDYTLTEAIDAQLLAAAKELPPKFWLPVNFSGMREGSQEVFWETMRMVDQFFHFILLVQLHLPYLLRRDGCPTVAYSKLACVNAAREILTRYVAFRSFNQVASSCRTADFGAFMGAMTLLLAHLDAHRIQKMGEICGTSSLLNHQRLGDRAMMAQVLENMEGLSKLSDDALTEESAKMLRRLLDVEEEAASAELLVDGPNGEEHILDITIPYLGSLRVTRAGIEPYGECRFQPPLNEPQNTVLNPVGSVHVANSVYSSGSSLNPTAASASASAVSPRHTFGHGGLLPLSSLTDQPVDVGLDPDLAAALDDWAFQGVDTAFFDSLMKGSGMPLTDQMRGPMPMGDGLGRGPGMGGSTGMASGAGMTPMTGMNPSSAGVNLDWEMGPQQQHHPL